MATHTHTRKSVSVPAVASSSTEETTSPLSPKTGIALVFLQPPPVDAKIPLVPQGSVAPGGANYRTLLPKATELAALAGAVSDLRRFASSFEQVFGLTGLPYAQVLQAFDVGNQWSTMRKASAAWDAFAQTQEGIAWGTIRAMMEQLGPIFEITAARDPSLAVTYPSLTSLLRAKKQIAQKGAVARRLNAAAIARGELPTHGVVGKKRQKAADKVIVAKAKAAALTVAPVVIASSTTPQGAVAVVAEPTTSSAQVVAPVVDTKAVNGAAN
jgi:hypothetical protein